MIYGAECWSIKRQHNQHISVVEIHMLRFMCGHTKKDWIMNDVVRYWFGVAPANEKLVQCRRRWFCHIQLMPPKDTLVEKRALVAVGNCH
jgi:hypothetical protein